MERADVRRTLVAVVVFTVIVEAIATVALSVILLADGLSFGSAVWRGFFHAIMAFNNAGFALWNGAIVGGAGGSLPGAGAGRDPHRRRPRPDRAGRTCARAAHPDGA